MMSNYGMNYWGGYGFGSSGPGFDKIRAVQTNEEWEAEKKKIEENRKRSMERRIEKSKERFRDRKENTDAVNRVFSKPKSEKILKHIERTKAKIEDLKANGDPENLLPLHEAELRELGKEVG